LLTWGDDVHREGSSEHSSLERNVVTLLWCGYGTLIAQRKRMSRTTLMTGSTELVAHSISGVAGTVVGVIAGLQHEICPEAVAGIVAIIAASTLALLKVLQVD